MENILVETTDSTVAELKQAIAIAQTPPKGPVRVGIPKNFLQMDVPLADVGEFTRESVTSVPPESVETAADILATADAPVIVVGGGVRAADASDALLQVADQVNAPIITTYKGRGVVIEDNPLSAGVLCGASSPELHAIFANADVVLGIGDGPRCCERALWLNSPGELIHVALHPTDIGVGYDPIVSLVCDSANALTAIEDEFLATTCVATDGEGRAKAVSRAEVDRLSELVDVDEPHSYL